ncbi:MAG TPA: hypothetical protein VHJ76_01305, partial [Actinomycetota bacterium]|nr:hypothetical protein [Actinomycetota bacterium]
RRVVNLATAVKGIGPRSSKSWFMPQIRRPLLAATVATIAVAAGLALLAPGPASSAGRPRSSSVVAAGGPHPFTWTWDPAEVTIPAGGKVTWENPTEAVHHVTFWRGPSSKSLHLHGRGSATLKFRKPGVYEYLCDIFGHAQLVDVGPERVCIGMCGTVTVR